MLTGVVRSVWRRLPAPVRLPARRALGLRPWGLRPFRSLYPPRPHAPINRPEQLSSVLSVLPGETHYYPPPTRLDSGRDPDPPLDARYAPSGFAVPAARELYCAEGAAVLGDAGLVYDPRTGYAVLETAAEWDRPAAANRVFERFTIPKSERLAGTTLLLASLDAGGFYHLLVDVVPKLRVAREWLEKVEHFLAVGSGASFHGPWLALAGIPPEKVIWVDGFSHFVCDRLLFTNRLISDCQPTGWLRDAIRDAFGVNKSVSATADRQIWVSRADANLRHIQWEQDLIKRLGRVEKVTLAGMSPSEQIALFQSARAVLGPHGAGLTGLVFAPPGGKLVELVPYGRWVPCFHRLASVCGWESRSAVTPFDRPPDDLDGLAARIRSFLDVEADSVGSPAEETVRSGTT